MAPVVELSIPTANGRSLGAYCYEPAVPAVGQIVIHGATATPQRYYSAWARHLSWRGFRVLTYDYRGIGRSALASMADDPTIMSDWLDDAAAAQQRLAARAPELPLLSIGHSFGGQIAAGIDTPRRPDGVLLVGVGSGWWRGYPPRQRPGLWLAWHAAVPALGHLFGYIPGWAGTGEDLPIGVARQWARWCTKPGYFCTDHPELRRRLARYDGRVLALSFTDDRYAPRSNVRWMLERLVSAQLTHRRLHPSDVGMTRIGHFGAFRATAADRLWPLATQFLADAAKGADTPSAGRPPTPALLEVIEDLQYGL